MGSLRNWFNSLNSRFRWRNIDHREWAGYQLRRAERRMDKRIAGERARMAEFNSGQLGEGNITRGPLKGIGNQRYEVDLGGGLTAPIESLGDEMAKLRDLPAKSLTAAYNNAMHSWRELGEAVPENAYIKGFHAEFKRRGLPVPIADDLHLLEEGAVGNLPLNTRPGLIERSVAQLSDDEIRKSLADMAAEPDRDWDKRLKPLLELELRSRSIPTPSASPEGKLGPLRPFTQLPPGIYGADIKTLPTEKLKLLYGLWLKTKPDMAADIANELRKRSEGPLGNLPPGLLPVATAAGGTAALLAGQPDAAQAGTVFRAPAVKVGDRVFEAVGKKATHWDAADKAMEELGIAPGTLWPKTADGAKDDALFGFVTNNGDFVSVEQAESRWPKLMGESVKMRKAGLLSLAGTTALDALAGLGDTFAPRPSIERTAEYAAMGPEQFAGAFGKDVADALSPESMSSLFQGLGDMVSHPKELFAALLEGIKERPGYALGSMAPIAMGAPGAAKGITNLRNAMQRFKVKLR